MNSQLIAKVIKSDETNVCPEFSYENPLLDRNVAKALARSFVKILKVSQQNSNINNNLRYSILTNIRKTCKIHPENHVELGEIATNLLTEIYTQDTEHTPDKHQNPVENDLNNFLIRKLKELDINANHVSPVNPEVAQSLINLDQNFSQTVSQNVLNVDAKKTKSMTFLKSLWMKPTCDRICDLSICMKPEIETVLLKLSYNILIEENVNLVDLFHLDYLKDLVHKCSMSPACFQICCEVLNCIFSSVNFSLKIQLFITEFVRNVRSECDNVSDLYCKSLSHIVVLLNTDLDIVPVEYQTDYVKRTLPFLNKLYDTSRNNFVMLLSHYPQWFDIYYEQ